MKVKSEEENLQSKQDRLIWLKEKLQSIWCTDKYCGFCLESADRNFCPLDMEFLISQQVESKSLRDILNYVFREDVEDMMATKTICEICVEKTMQAYMFMHNTKLISKVMLNCVSDIYSKAVDVTNQILGLPNDTDINVMIVLENEEQIHSYIDEIKASPEIVPALKPITIVKTEPTPKILNTCTIPKPIVQAKVREEVERKLIKVEGTPNITLEQGKLLIKPLIQKASVPVFNTYCCNHCTDIFTSYRSLKEHEKAKHSTILYSCSLCEKTYNSQQYLTIHYQTHGKERCKICQDILEAGTLNEHLRNNHLNSIHMCTYCDLVYYSGEQLEIHVKATHIKTTPNVQQCVMCLKNFPQSKIKTHKCKFSCPECITMPCIHLKYLKSFREQVLNYTTEISCPSCNYITKRKEHLITHANREHLDHHPFTCDHCGNQFYTKQSLRIHIVQYHEDLKCEYCDYDFKTLKSLENHKHACKHIIRTYNCEKCVASFDTEEELMKHDSVRHSEIVYPCNLCKKEFVTELNLQEHQSTIHTGIQIKRRRRFIECTLCDMTFNNIKELLEHEQTHDPNEKYPCKVCTKEFTSLRKLYTHKQKHYTERITCTACKKKIAAAYYGQHCVRCPYVKGQTLSHICETCGKSFHLESLLRIHLKIHMKKESCHLCGKMIKPSGMTAHLQLMHGKRDKGAFKKKPLTTMIACKICGHLVKKKSDLEPHMNRYHYKIKPYSCNICDKTFCGKARLMEHMNTHRGENAVYCSECGKKFANRVCLKMHFRMHTGEAPYTCEVCGQKFRTSSMMKTHHLKKHQQKTVQCPLCDYMFHLERDMRNHFKKNHWKYKDRPFNYKEVPELDPKYYHMFEDHRLPKID